MTKIDRMTFKSEKSKRNYQRFSELLNTRLNKLGHISLGDAWLIVNECLPISYQVAQVYFRKLMDELIYNGRAERLKNGNYWIYKNEAMASRLNDNSKTKVA